MAHADLFLFGKTLVFSVILNLLFFGATLVTSIWAFRQKKKTWLPVLLPITIWLVLAVILGLPAYILAFFGSPSTESIQAAAKIKEIDPEWIDKAVLGPPVSAATPYQHDAYTWSLYLEVLSD
ncbi:hypothetical protein [Cerasicoccus fimbriatus]|uniref:hypothetical protein n=1 Tax=Cerasicoccus fimbriatus TaxID=3014554 RepID=UPI0022B57911|nr:hypothetical protein [Cerasicoccus sp. TK19100]